MPRAFLAPPHHCFHTTATSRHHAHHSSQPEEKRGRAEPVVAHAQSLVLARLPMKKIAHKKTTGVRHARSHVAQRAAAPAPVVIMAALPLLPWCGVRSWLALAAPGWGGVLLCLFPTHSTRSPHLGFTALVFSHTFLSRTAATQTNRFADYRP